MVSLGGIARKLFGSSNDRRIKSYRPDVAAIGALEDSMKALSDAELAGKTADFKAQLAAGKTTDDLVVPAFAVVREAARRSLGMRPFDVQLMGGMILNDGAIAEMKRVKARRLWRRLPSTSMRSPARASTSSPSTTISQAATPSRWASSTAFSGFRPASSFTVWTMNSARRPMPATSPMPRTTNSASTICATT